MNVTDHALERAKERFNYDGGMEDLRNYIRTATKFFYVEDRQNSINWTRLTKVKVVVRGGAYFVIRNDTVVTVLTEEQGMRNLKHGKWVLL